MIHLGLNVPGHDAKRVARQRTVTPANAFEDRNQRPALDFNSKAGTASQSSGMGGSVLDLYAPTWKAEQAQKDANSARADKLLPAVRQLAQSHGLDIDALEVINIVVRNAKIMRGEATVFASDAARAVGIETRKAEAIISDAVFRGLLEDRGGHRFRSKI